MAARATGLIPMAGVVDVQRSIDFYGLLGLSVKGSHTDPGGKLVWAHIRGEGADLMLTLASAVDPTRQGVGFYLYSPDLVALRNHLLAHGVKVTEIAHPFYMPKGEVCLTDPDGYTLLIGQAE